MAPNSAAAAVTVAFVCLFYQMLLTELTVSRSRVDKCDVSAATSKKARMYVIQHSLPYVVFALCTYYESSGDARREWGGGFNFKAFPTCRTLGL